MADEVVKILKVQTAGSEQTVKGLREEIKGLQDALLNLDSGTKEYDEALKKLIDDQTKLNGVMNAGKESGIALEGSYNALQQRLNALTKAWKATNDEATQKKLGKEIKEIRGQLSKLDESTGDFRRNVGNYANSMSQAFSSMGGAVTKISTGPLKTFKAGLTAISSHPIIAVVTLLAGLLINGLAKGFKSSEGAMDKLTQAFAAFKPIGDFVLKIFQGLADGIATAVGWIAQGATWLLDKLIPGYKEAADKRTEIAKNEEKISKTERENIKKNADSRKAAATARAKAEDKEKYTVQERIKFLKEAQAEEEKIAERDTELAKQKFLNMQAQLALTESTAEEQKELNELYAAWQDAQTSLEDKKRQNNKKLARLNQEAYNDAKNAAKARLDLEKSLIDQEYDLAEQGSEDQIRLAKEKRKKELEIQLLELKDKIKNRKEYEKAEKMAREKYNRDLQKIDQEGFQGTLGSVDSNTRLQALKARENSAEKLGIELQGEQEKLRLLKEYYDNILTATTATTKARQDAELQYNEQLQKTNALQDRYLNTLKQERDAWREVELYNYEPELVKVQKQMEYLQYDYLNLRKLNNESEVEFLTRRRKLLDEIVKLSHRENELISETLRERKRELADAKKIEDYIFASTYGPLEGRLWAHMRTKNVMQTIKRDIKDDADDIGKFIHNVWWTDILGRFGSDEDDIVSRVRNQLKVTYKGLLKPEELDIKTDEVIDSLFGGTDNLVEKFRDRLKEARDNGDVVNFLNDFVKAGILPQEVLDNYIALLKKMVDDEENLLRQRYENWNNLATHISDISGSIGDIYEENLNQRKEQLEAEGKYDEKAREQLEKEYKNVKAFKIAQATINTIQGALAAYMGYQELGQPWGMILGSAAAAAVLASGYAQVQKIKNTDPYKETGTSDSAVFPTTTPYVPQYTQNVTGLQETEQLANAIAKQNIWVSVKDIDSAQQGNKVKVAESRW